MTMTLMRRRTPTTSLAPSNGDFARLRDEMDRTFERFLGDPLGLVEPKFFRTEGWIPPLDLSETDTELTIRLEAPGIGAKDLDISISGRTLTISGEKSEQQEKKGENFYHCERRFGSFRRVVELPETVDVDKVAAEADNGVIAIHIPKKPGAKPKQVEIKPSTGRKVAVNS
ncbi:MAG: Hsp20/alpha crystallin family protein [Phycisphaeraceae bacterium]|nr:Hsp20/alpha crystallin family protein [Phycisphaeraceae bacterium]